ncbi:MAG TPA: efflux RND transporter periplasmic adaptor subunit, partial [Phycisphaerae bacterium]|nr:efflux RND transporter periplasmic adaptor subunit [Phycisphaerae bacterium]
MKKTFLLILLVLSAGAIGLIAGLIISQHAQSPSTGTSRISTTLNGPTLLSASSPAQKILYYWDPMLGPSSISPKPGISAMGMQLVPVYAQNQGGNAGEIRVDPAMIQDMGFQTAPVRLGSLTRTIRTVAVLRVPDSQRHNVTLRVSGWIDQLYAAVNGNAIHKGDKLFTLYSPELLAAQQQLVAAQQAVQAAYKTGDAQTIADAQALANSLQGRLQFLGVDDAQIQNIILTLKTSPYLTFYAPVSGLLTNVNVQQQSYVSSGNTVLMIEQLDPIWLQASVYENQIDWIHPGQTMTAQTDALPGKTFSGKIIYIDPYEDSQTHTIAVRALLDNSDGNLRPGMYATAYIQTQPLDKAILAPREAIIDTGSEQLVFVQETQGHFNPVRVVTGLEGDGDLVEVLSGLGPGQQVVTSGQFLLDVESRIQEAGNNYLLGATGSSSSAGPA